MVILDSFPFSNATFEQDETRNSLDQNESPSRDITIGFSADSVAEFVEDSGELPSTESQFLRCGKCQYQTKIGPLLQKHVAKHLLDSDFQCSLCDFHESDNNLFVDHFATHHKGTTLKCPVCHKKFQKSELKSHIKIHKAVTLYDCSMCEFSTNYVKSIKNHTEAFHGRIYKCPHCSLGLTKHELQLHMKSAHNSESSSLEMVAKSVESALSPSRKNTKISAATSVKTHIEAMHTTEYQCTKCNQVMPKHDQLQHMMAVHTLDDSSTNTNQNPIGISNKSPQTTGNPTQDSDAAQKTRAIRKSLRTAKGLRSNANQVLGKDSKNSALTNILGMIKTNKKSSSALSQGLGKYPLCCSLCDYSSNINCNLRRHTEALHGKEYQCKKCNQSMSKYDLRLHEEASHGLQGSTLNVNQDFGKVAPRSSTKNSLKTAKNYPKSSHAHRQSSNKHPHCCSLCEYSTMIKRNFIRHSKAWHCKKFCCKECNQMMSKHDYLLHMAASHGRISEGLETTKHTTSALAASCNQSIHDISYVKASERSQMLSTIAGEVQLSEIHDSLPKDLPQSHDNILSRHSRLPSLKIKPLSLHKFRTQFSQNHSNALGDAHSTGNLQHIGEVVERRSVTFSSEPITQQREPNCRKCEYCSNIFVKNTYLKHFIQCASRSIPDEVGDENKFGGNASKNIPTKPVTGAQEVASGFALLQPNRFGLDKWRVVLKRLDHSKLKSAVNAKSHVQKRGFVLAIGKITKKPMLCCSMCTFNTKRRKLLKKHVSKHLKDLSLTCPYCGFKEMIARVFVRHIGEHLGDKTKFKCCFCDSKPFSNKYSLSDHLWKHRPTTLLDCSNCEFSTYRSDTLRKHVEETHIKKYRCQMCGVTMNKFRLGKHISKAHGPVMLNNDVSHCTFLTVEEPRFLKNRIPDNNYEECTTDISSVPSYLRTTDQSKDLDLQTSANPEEAKSATGTIVSKNSIAEGPDSTPNSDALTNNGNSDVLAVEQELAKRNPIVSLRNPCVPLRRQTVQKKVLRNLIKPYLRCSKCSFKTRIKSLLKQHVVKHLIDNQFACTKCDFKDSCSWKFTKHWLTHHTGSEIMIGCCFCTAQYKKQSCLKGSLPRHLEQHRVVQLFDCSKCGFSHSDKYALERHYLKYHKTRHCCTSCEKSMTLNRLLKHTCQSNNLFSEGQVFERPSTLEHGKRGAGEISETYKHLPTPKVCAELEFSKPSCSLSVPPCGLNLTESSSMSLDVTLHQTDTTTSLSMPCDMDEEYFCVVCKRWVSLDDFAIHQQQCTSEIDTQLAISNEASNSLPRMENGSEDESLLSNLYESVDLNLEQHEASNQSVELVNKETGQTLVIEPIVPDNFSSSAQNLGSRFTVPTNAKSRGDFDEGVELTALKANVTYTESKVQSASTFNSGDTIISVSSDSEDSYGTPYCNSEMDCDSELFVDNSIPPMDISNVIRGRLKNLLKVPNTDEIVFSSVKEL